MILLYMCIILIISFFIIKSTIEPLDNNNSVFLLGDSIYKNNDYVSEHNSVEFLLKTKHKNSFVYAQDNTTIQQLTTQFNQIPKHFIRDKNNYIYVSCGGNDILNTYEFHNFHDLQLTDHIFDKYKLIILNIKNYIKCNLVLTNIYFPTSNLYTDYHPIIKHWNSLLKTFCLSHNIALFEIDSYFHDNSFFVSDIEPSAIGSKSIVRYILSN